MKIIARLAITVTILSLFVAAGCERKGHNVPKRGSYCTVQFRRDTLGAAADLPIPPTSNMHNGAQTCVTGKFSRMDEDWVILTEGKDETWIPRSVILLIKTYSQEPP
jgi:hypothetical protein